MRNSVRHANLIALATALLVMAGPAQAAPVKVKPTAAVVGAAKSGKQVRFQIDVKFPIPAGASAADCSGKVAVSTKLSKNKTAKWSGKLTALGPDCVAKVKATLASTKFGKKLKFTVAFKGNKKLKPFSRQWILKIVAPPPAPPLDAPPAPTPVELVGVHNKGSWDINEIGNDNGDFEFFIKPDYSVSEITSTDLNAKIQLTCNSTNPKASMTFNTGFVAKSDTVTVSSTQNDAFNQSMVHTFHFSWTSPISGVGHYSSSGQYNVGTELAPVWEQCTGGFNFELEHFGSVT